MIRAKRSYTLMLKGGEIGPFECHYSVSSFTEDEMSFCKNPTGLNVFQSVIRFHEKISAPKHA